MTAHVLDRTERRTREETAALLRSLAADFETGRAFGIAEDATVDVPEEMDVTIELERETAPENEGEAFELEVEIEWTDADVPDAVLAHGETEPKLEAETGAQPAGDETVGDEAADEDDAAFDATDVAPGSPDDTTAETAGAAGTPETDEEAAPPSLARFQVYRDRGGEWRWRLVHRNGNIIATSGEGYASRQNAEKGMRSVMRNASGAEMTREG